VSNKKVLVPLSRDVALALVKDAIENCDLGLKELHETPTGLSGRTGASLRSFGSRIAVSASEVPTGTELTVSVNPQAALIDWGRSDEESQSIVNEILRMLREGD
jgi:hypothetical protein